MERMMKFFQPIKDRIVAWMRAVGDGFVKLPRWAKIVVLICCLPLFPIIFLVISLALAYFIFDGITTDHSMPVSGSPQAIQIRRAKQKAKALQVEKDKLRLVMGEEMVKQWLVSHPHEARNYPEICSHHGVGMI